MFRHICALLLIISVGRFAWSAPVDEINETLARAEALYYQADFTKSIELLLRLDDVLRTQSDHLQERINLKLQLALAYLGLNDSARAKVYFAELYALDSEYAMDSQTFSPKVVQLAEQAKAEQREVRCRTTLKIAEQQLEMGNAEGARALIASGQAKCPAMAAIAPGAAELFYKQGVEEFRKARMASAQQKFRVAVELHPQHELAAQYLELTQNRLQVDADRALVAWRKDFNAGDLVSAAAEYRDLLSVSSSETINEVRAEYRKALSTLVESWNLACKNYDATRMEEIRAKAGKLLPEASLGEDILAKMTTCTPAGCLPMSAELALARLRTRVDPEFPQQVVAQLKASPVTVRVKTRINEKGDVVSSEPQAANPMLSSPIEAAVDRWKFFPILFQGEPRCVDTEIPIVIKVRTSN
jgi:hypothetical protein